MRALHPSRRALLKAAGALSLAAPLGSLLPRRAYATGGRLVHPMIERTSRPLNYETPLDAFLTRITPVERFYIRNHFDVPNLEAGRWRLEVEGLVDKPLSLALGDLERLKQVTVEAVLQCAGNGRGLLVPHVAGVQWERGAVGNALWTGPRLRDVLALARPRSEARYVELQGGDRSVLEQTPRFIRGIPLAKAMHEDTIIALRMNGVALPLLHGFPARLVVPGWVADDWMKWLSRISLSANEPQGFFYQTAYRFPVAPVAPGTPVPPEMMVPMKGLVVKSLIASPVHQSVVPPGRLMVKGVAFSGEHRLTKVEISVDGGASWKRARLEAGGRYGFSLFELTFEASPGKLRLLSRASDESGAVQPSTPVWNPSGYLYNAIDGVDVEVR